MSQQVIDYSFKTKKSHLKTSSSRHRISIDRSGLWKGSPIKSLTAPLHSSGGRNNAGRITAQHLGGGHKRKYRKVDFKRRADGEVSTVERLEYDPNRSAYLALLSYENKYSYIIAPRDIKPGMSVVSGDEISPTVGNAMPLRSIPIGSLIYNVEIVMGGGGQIARSAGCCAKLLGFTEEGDRAVVEMPSKRRIYIDVKCRATIGVVSNPEHRNCALGKAGANRYLGRKPVVTGRNKNHHEHAHGGKNKRDDRGMHNHRRGKKTVKIRQNKRMLRSRRYKL